MQCEFFIYRAIQDIIVGSLEVNVLTLEKCLIVYRYGFRAYIMRIYCHMYKLF
jgi:hypothetical protein